MEASDSVTVITSDIGRSVMRVGNPVIRMCSDIVTALMEVTP